LNLDHDAPRWRPFLLRRRWRKQSGAGQQSSVGSATKNAAPKRGVRVTDRP
jgi:hypothetical protein